MAEKQVTIKLSGDAKELNSALQQSLRNVQDFGGVLEKVGRSQGIAFSSALQQDVKQLEILHTHLIKINAPAADLEKVTKKLTEAQLKFKESLKTDAMKQQEAAIDSLRAKYNEQNSALSNLGKTITDNRAGFQALGGVMTAMGGAVIGSLGVSAKAAIDFESAFAGVRKTVNASEPELATMREQFLAMSTEIPVSASELSKLGQVAGQLGVRKENVVSFARVIADLGISSNLAGEEGATMLAQFGNIVKLDQTKYSNLASALVDLGNNSATTEKDIAAMGLRLAGAGDAAGLSAPQILGLSASLASVGIEAEAGGTAFSQLLIKMQKSTKEGGDSLKQFAQVSGLTSAQFKKAFEEDAAGALVTFLKGVDGLNKSGANTFAILEGMGIEGIRMTDAITRAANANDRFEGSIKRSSEAFDKNTALAKEAGERYKTVESQLQILANTATNLAVRIGEAVLPAVQAFVDVAQPVISAVADWAKANPALTTTIIAVGGAIGGLMLTIGPLLFALPSIVEGFALVKGAVLALGPAMAAMGASASGAIASLGGLGALAGYTALIVAATAAIGGIVLSFMSWREAVAGWESANKGLDDTTHKLNERLKQVGKEVQRGNLSWEEWTQKVQLAAKENSGLINKLGDQERAQAKTAATTKTAAQTAAELAAKTAAQAEAAAKAKKEVEGWGNAIGVTIPKLKQTVAEGEKYVAYLKRSKAGAEEIREAELKLAEARLALVKATSPLLRETEKLLQATKDLEKAEIANAGTLRAAGQTALQFTDRLRSLGVVAGTDLPANFGKPKTALLDLEAAFKTLGVTSTKTLQQQATEAAAAYESIAQSGQASARDIALAWAAMAQAQIDATVHAGGKIDIETQKTVDAIKSKYGDLKNDKNANLSTWRELASKQVSTLVSDVSKGFADILTAGGSFGSKMVAMFKQIGQGMLQGFFESGIGGLLSGKGLAGFGGFAGGILDAIKGIGGGGKGGALTSLAGLIPGLGGKGGLLAGLGALGGIGGGALATGGLSLGAAGLGGVLPGSIMAGFGGGLTGTAGGTAAAASSGGLMSSLGALATNPFTIAAAAAIGGVLLTRRFTRRGREKEDATGEAEAMSGDVWGSGGIVDTVKQGKATIDEGIAAIQQRFADYEAWLRANLKDQTVITRSIEGQRITLTESIAVLEQLRGKEAETAALRAGLEQAIEDFAKTGAISQEFSDLIVKLGGNLEEFKANIADTSKLEGLRDGFGGLRESLQAMIPATEDMFAAFLRTGEVSEDLRKALDETGLSAREQTAALLKMAEFAKATDDLDDFTSGIGSLREQLGALAIPVRSAYESFIELNEITPALRDEINRFGLDIEAFEEFSAINKLRNDFKSLSQTILETGEGAADLKSIFESVGADTSILDAAGQMAGLKAQQSELRAFMADLAKIAPAQEVQKTDLQRFIESGTMSPEFMAKLTAQGADTSKFTAFAGARSDKERLEDLIKEFEKTKTITQEMKTLAEKFGINLTGTSDRVAELLSQAQGFADSAFKATAAALGIEVGKLADAVETEIGKLRTALETALTDVGTKLDTQFEDSRLALIGQLNTLETGLTSAVDATRLGLIGALGKIDTHLTNAVNGLKTDLNTAINNLTAAINSVNIPGGAAPTTVPPESTPTTPEPTTHTGDRSARAFEDYGSVRGYAVGGVVPSTGLAMVHRGETVIPPDMMASLLAGFQFLKLATPVNPYIPQQATAAASAAVAGAPKVEQNIVFNHVSDDEYTHRKMLERVNDQLIDRLARGG